MTVEEAYALSTLIAAGAGVLTAAGSYGARGIIGLAAFYLVAWLAMTFADTLSAVGMGTNISDMGTVILVVAVIGSIGLSYLRLGWLARLRWSVARGLLALAGLAGLAALGFALTELFPGSGFLPNMGYAVGIYGLALPAAVGFGLGLAAATVMRRA